MQTDALQEENSKLKLQLEMINRQEVKEKEHVYQHGELKDKKVCDMLFKISSKNR